MVLEEGKSPLVPLRGLHGTQSTCGALEMP